MLFDKPFPELTRVLNNGKDEIILVDVVRRDFDDFHKVFGDICEFYLLNYKFESQQTDNAIN